MKEKGLISVIIPVYNVEKYLRECIDSVLAQTYKSYEIILVDDGSTDSSGKICDEYALEYDCVTVIHKENGGPSLTRNIGLSRANGEYIYFLDSDDYIAPEAFEKLIKISIEHNADVVFFDGVSFIDGKPDATIRQGYKRTHIYEPASGLSMLDNLNKNSEFKCVVYLMLIKKTLLEENGLRFCEDTFYSEDMLFVFQLYCYANKVVQLPEALYYRRYRADSIVTSRKEQGHFRSCKVVYNEFTKFCENENLTEISTAVSFIVRSAFNVFNVYEKLNGADKALCKNEFKSFKNEILLHNAYGDKALKMRCYGKALWLVYKVFEKTIGRLFV